MKKHITLGLVASTLFLVGCGTTHHITRWEFKNVTVFGAVPDQNPTLNQLGKDGWLVVGFVHEPGDSQHNEYYRYILKRKLQ